ncbi:hypothetical protein H5410_032837 [Solanum commersonii]|uniref:AIPP2-like SPOC-like domain-containing protein n=1 Tax=Solanum commersonii TaxID=4109 RepID=A0A9J5YL30_SOLCO|nr:hypothetical protein H5410_032837 [Solanum commersonii]
MEILVIKGSQRTFSSKFQASPLQQLAASAGQHTVSIKVYLIIFVIPSNNVHHYYLNSSKRRPPLLSTRSAFFLLVCRCGAQMTTHSPRQKGRHPHKKNICEICSDICFEEPIITCYQCKNIDAHQHCVQGYCVDEPKDWCFQKCNIDKGVLSLSRGLENDNSDGSMGSFDILCTLEFVPGMLNNCIQAHPPSKVRRKVYEFSRVLPDTLKFELVPHGDIRTSLFNNHIPGREDIGLYFFANKKERSQRYIALVDFMHSKDLVMRTFINNVQLLVLASTTLCSDCQRWNNEHFLWGLFYHMGQDKDGYVEGDNNKVIDMEVDMIAGENIGTMDIVVSKVIDMEVDMEAGENVGTLDIVVSKVIDMEVDMIT